MGERGVVPSWVVRGGYSLVIRSKHAAHVRLFCGMRYMDKASLLNDDIFLSLSFWPSLFIHAGCLPFSAADIFIIFYNSGAMVYYAGYAQRIGISLRDI